jgi:transposase
MRLIADHGYDHDKYRRLAWKPSTKQVCARRHAEHGSGLGCVHWVVERISRGSTTAADSCAPTAATTSTKTSLPSPAGSAASGSWKRHCVRLRGRRGVRDYRIVRRRR